MSTFSLCVHCGAVVAQKKYTCEVCHGTICEAHRATVKHGPLRSPSYRCLYGCPPPATAAAPAPTPPPPHRHTSQVSSSGRSSHMSSHRSSIQQSGVSTPTAGSRRSTAPVLMTPHELAERLRQYSPLPGETNAAEFVERMFQLHRTLGRLQVPDDVLSGCRGQGLPLPQLRPLDGATRTRLAYFNSTDPPVRVDAEGLHRYVRIGQWTSGVAGSTEGDHWYAQDGIEVLRGTLLGYAENHTTIVWHERNEKFATLVPLASIALLLPERAVVCRHCGCVFPYEEQGLHLETHQKGGGGRLTMVDDPRFGTACGDTRLLHELVPVCVLGSGAQGEVSLCERLDAGGAWSPGKFVVKKMVCGGASEAEMKYHQSVRLMNLTHDHLVEYLAVQLHPDKRGVSVFMAFYEEGDLANMIRRFTEDRFNEGYICSIALQILTALSFLQERNPPIIHGDIKPENILLFNHKQQVLLMDFDASRELEANSSSVESEVGTTAWMAPEALHRRDLMPASDLWSLGAVLYVFAVLPEFPMITHPQTQEMELLNSLVWEVPSPQGTTTTATAAAAPVALRSCVVANITRRGYSHRFAHFIADLLEPTPCRRPSPGQAIQEVTSIITDILVHDPA